MVNDHGFRVASTDPLFLPTIGGVTWPYRGKTWSVDPSKIPTVLRGGTAIYWPADNNPVSPWLKARAATEEDLIAVGVDVTNSTEVAGIRERRTGRRQYLDNERRQLCHKLFRKEGEGLVEALVDEEAASLADRCAAAFPTAAVASAVPTETASPVTPPRLSPPETTMVPDTAGFITVTTKLAAPTLASG